MYTSFIYVCNRAWKYSVCFYSRTTSYDGYNWGFINH